TGANVNRGNLKLLARTYPQLVAGTPISWSFTAEAFHFTFSTKRATSAGYFGRGAQTIIATPRVQYPRGYRVRVTGGYVISKANAAVLVVATNGTSRQVLVTVTRRS
ncbi:MAG TPA: hypothetical protein VN108_09320, partial [Marmoricola sp.]|nr:hypothetical protein [Marmoricola sp.]